MSSVKYVAFLRGINSGKNPTIKMELLKNVFLKFGYQNVKTILASGNVVFEADEKDRKKLSKKLESALPKELGFKSRTIIRTVEEIEDLIRSNPFKEASLTPQTKPYVTFLADGVKPKLKFPVRGQGYTILGNFNNTIYSVVDLTQTKTPDLMKVLDKELGLVTTRSWNTVEKIVTS